MWLRLQDNGLAILMPHKIPSMLLETIREFGPRMEGAVDTGGKVDVKRLYSVLTKSACLWSRRAFLHCQQNNGRQFGAMTEFPLLDFVLCDSVYIM